MTTDIFPITAATSHMFLHHLCTICSGNMYTYKYKRNTALRNISIKSCIIRNFISNMNQKIQNAVLFRQ